MPDMLIWFSSHTDSRLEVPFGILYTDRMKNKNTINNPINLPVLLAGSIIVIINIVAFALLPR